MLRICVDMDEVMADKLSEHLRRYNQTFDEDVTPDDLAGKGLWEFTPLDRQAQLRAFLDAAFWSQARALAPVWRSMQARSSGIGSRSRAATSSSPAFPMHSTASAWRN